MKRLVKMFVWLMVFVLLLTLMDQWLLRYPGFEQPFLRDVQEFHRDFRRRLFGLSRMPAPQNQAVPATEPYSAPDKDADAVVEREITRVKRKEAPDPQAENDTGSLRYIYLDAEQNIQFAERYEEIPPQFRDAVQVVGE